MKYDWLSTARFISWNHYRLNTLEEARKQAKELKSYGANTVITFGHHYRFHHVDIWDQHKESLDNVVTACHELGLRVIEHHSATFVPPESLNKFEVDGVPLTECAVIDARDGKPAYFDEYEIIMLCCNNPKFRKIYFDYVLNLVKETGVDGLMSDDIEFCPTWHVCACDYCREKLARTTGDTIPEPDSSSWGNFEDPWFRRWLRFRMHSVGDYYADLRKAMDQAGLQIPLLGCLAGASNRHLAQKWAMTGEEFARGVDLNFYEAWHSSNNLLLWRTQAAEINYYLGIGKHFGGQPMFTLHYTSLPEEQFFVWALNLLVGDRLWLGAPVHYPEQTYEWENRYPELFKSPETVSNIALLFSRQTRDVYGGYDDKYYIQEWLGWSQMLLEANIPAHTILDTDLTGDLSQYKLLILPNAVCLSDAQIEGIRRFAANGGKVIFTSETAFRDETGAVREKPALADWMKGTSSQITYYADKVGATQYYETPYFGSDETERAWEDTRDLKVRDQLLTEVKRLAGSLPWELVETEDGILANVHRVQAENGPMLVAHLLNVAPLDLGKKCVIQKKCDLSYNPESLPGPVSLILRDVQPKSAMLYSPDNTDPIPLSVVPEKDTWKIRIESNQIRRYGAIRIDLV